MKFLNSFFLFSVFAPFLLFGQGMYQQENFVVEQTVTSNFPSSIIFRITLAPTQKQIQSAYLFVQPIAQKVLAGETFTKIKSVKKGSNVQFTKVLTSTDMWRWKTYQQLPFAPHEYYWIIYFADGSHFQTPTQLFYFEDHHKYPWQSKQQGIFLFRWYGKDEKLIADMIDQAQAAFDELSKTYPIQPKSPIQVIIYQDAKDLNVWNNYNANFIALSSLLDGTLTVIASEVHNRQVFRHEITHFGLYYSTGETAYKDIPEWIVEGLAVYHERDDGNLTKAHSRLMDKINTGTVPALSEMDTDPKWDNLNAPYAEAYSAVTYLVETYGEEKIKAILPQFHRYGTPALTFKEEWGISYADISNNWHKWLQETSWGQTKPPADKKITVTPTLSQLGASRTVTPTVSVGSTAPKQAPVVCFSLPLGLLIVFFSLVVRSSKHKV